LQNRVPGATLQPFCRTGIRNPHVTSIRSKGNPIETWARKNWFYVGMAAVLVVGYLWGAAGRWLNDHNRALIATLMFTMGLGLSPTGIARQLKKPKALSLFLASSYGLAPCLAFVVAFLFFRPHGWSLCGGRQDLFTGLVIVGATATTLSTCIVWTRLAGGNDALSLVMSVLGNSIQFLASPVWLFLLLGAAVKFDVAGMMKSLLLVVLIPVAASQTVVVLSKGRTLRYKPATSLIGRLLVLAIIWMAVYKARDYLLTRDALYVSAAVVTIHGALLALNWWGPGRLLTDGRDRIALLFCGSQKTLPASVMIASVYFRDLPAAALPVLLYHFWQLVVDSILLERLPKHEHTPGETKELLSGNA